MLNLFGKKTTIEKRMEEFSKKLFRDYGDKLPSHYPGMQSLKKIAAGKETYTSDEVIQSLVNEETALFQGEYLQCLKALRRRKNDGKYSPEELPKPVEEGLKKSGHNNIKVFQDVYDTNVFSPMHKAIRELERSGKTLSKEESYNLFENVNTIILNNPDFKNCLKSIAQRL